ncbi:hypothetical protein [Catelliglobosispora koreensis]|uniref:hypothetical protein n=1 Tax=Catelliglobosispora koreensis TaxID=129052 RepID=UPI0003A30FE0|nr:hypothetical protein [Catelliglobosispora koreensis]
MFTAGLAAFLGFAALAGQGGPTATAGEPLASDGNVTAVAVTDTQRTEADVAATRSLANRPMITDFGAAEPVLEKQAEAPKAEEKPAPPAEPAPVAGLDQTQMNNAKKIVETAKSMGLGKRAQVIAIATAMQESQLRNLASTVYPESYRYTNEGEGSDHDSVGLFQQRPQSGWGTVENLLKPEYATKAFLKALVQVPGWENLPLTVAAQSVQVSAFPDHYAKHEDRATTVVDALQ